jgi:hypothetical protein
MLPFLVGLVDYTSMAAGLFIYTYWMRNEAEKEGKTLTVSLSGGWKVA